MALPDEAYLTLKLLKIFQIISRPLNTTTHRKGVTFDEMLDECYNLTSTNIPHDILRCAPCLLCRQYSATSQSNPRLSRERVKLWLDLGVCIMILYECPVPVYTRFFQKTEKLGRFKIPT